MRKTLITLIVLAALWLSYAITPILALYHLVNAVQVGNIEAVTERIDFNELRLSVTQQLLRMYLRLTGRDKMSPLAQDIIVAAGTPIADPIVAKFVSPEALVEFLRYGWPKAVFPDQPASGFSGVSTSNLGSAWEVFVNSEYGFGSFRISLPADAPRNLQFGLQLNLSNWTWKLRGVDLPEAIQIRLAQEINTRKKMHASTRCSR